MSILWRKLRASLDKPAKAYYIIGINVAADTFVPGFARGQKDGKPQQIIEEKAQKKRSTWEETWQREWFAG